MSAMAVPSAQWPMLAPRHLPLLDGHWHVGDSLMVSFQEYRVEHVVRDPNGFAYLLVAPPKAHFQVDVKRPWAGWHTVTSKRSGPVCDGCPDWLGAK